MAKSILYVREETTALATYFEQFDTLKVTADMAADSIFVEVIVINSKATSHMARVAIDYRYLVVHVQFCNRYTLEPKGKPKLVRSTEELEVLLRKHKVLVDAKLIRFEAASDAHLLTLAKSEGFDEGTWGAASKAYWRGLDRGLERGLDRGIDNGFLHQTDRAAIIKQLRALGFKSVDVTNPSWIDVTTKELDSVGVSKA